MIIKLKTRVNIYSSKQLVRYLIRYDKVGNEKCFDRTTFLQNIDYLEPDRIHKSFVQNYHFQKRKASNIALRHEVISIHPEDKKYVTVSMINRLRDTYIQVRGLQNCVLLAQAHFEKKNVHIHFMISANEFRSNKKVAIGHNKLRDMLKEFERYYIKEFPMLERSLVHTKKEKQKYRDRAKMDQNTRREVEGYMKQRMPEGKKTSKEKAFKIIDKLFTESKNLEVLVSKIRAEKEIEIYTYRNVIKGVLFEGRKYRFRTLGIEPERVQRLKEAQSRLRDLELLREMHGRERDGRGSRGR